MPRTTSALLAACVVAAFGSAALIAQPSIDPPAGPIEESGRFGTVIELTQATAPGDADSVFKITSPGSYILTSDVEIPEGFLGIEIASDDITIDLNGYTLRGPAQGSRANTGVGVTPNPQASIVYSGLKLRNGTIRNVERGVRTQSSFIQFPTFINLSVRDSAIEGVDVYNARTGMDVREGAVRNCRVETDTNGILMDTGSVESSYASIVGETGGTAISIRIGRVSDSVGVLSTVSNGGLAFSLRDASAYDCVATLAGDDAVGFRSFGNPVGAVVSRCSVHALQGFTGSGSIAFDVDGALDGCVATNLNIGFQVDRGVVRGCVAIGVNTPSSFGVGVTAADNNF